MESCVRADHHPQRSEQRCRHARPPGAPSSRAGRTHVSAPDTGPPRSARVASFIRKPAAQLPVRHVAEPLTGIRPADRPPTYTAHTPRARPHTGVGHKQPALIRPATTRLLCIASINRTTSSALRWASASGAEDQRQIADRRNARLVVFGKPQQDSVEQSIRLNP